jgi:hypothetical protein
MRMQCISSDTGAKVINVTGESIFKQQQSLHKIHVGRTERNEHSTKFSRILWRRPRPKLGCGAKERRKDYEELDGNIVTSIIGPLVASSVSNTNAKSAHAHLSRSRHALREYDCNRHVVSSTCCHWISCERGNLGKSHLRATSWRV